MVQVLPYVPTFGEKLADTVANATGQLAEGYAARQANIKGQAAIKVLNDPNSTPMQKFTASLELPESLRKHSGQALAALIGPGAEAQAQLDQIAQFKSMLGGGAPMQGQPQGRPMPTQQPQATQGPGQVNAMPPPNANQMMNMASPQGQPVQQPQGNMPQPMAQPMPGPQAHPEAQQPAFNVDDIRTYPEDKLQMARSLKGPFGDVAREEYSRRQKEIDRSEKQFYKEREFHTKGSEKAVEEARGLRRSVPRKESALALAADAVASGEVGALSLNNIAERLGVPELKTAKGAQLVTAGKENLISNISGLSARAQNQWIEQRFASMFPQIGQSKEANDTITEMIKSEIEMDRVYLDEFNKLEKQDMEQFGYVRRDIDARAHAAVDAVQNEIMNKTSYKLREIYEREKGIPELTKAANQKVPKGTPLTIQNAKIMANKFGGDFKKGGEHALKLGYRIPNEKEWEKWQ